MDRQHDLEVGEIRLDPAPDADGIDHQQGFREQIIRQAREDRFGRRSIDPPDLQIGVGNFLQEGVEVCGRIQDHVVLEGGSIPRATDFSGRLR